MSYVRTYVRTKDGIYKYADYLGIHNGKSYALMDDAQGNRITMCQEPEELYERADTIDELCDEFVLIDKDGNRNFVVPTGKPRKYYYKYDGSDDIFDFSNRDYELGEGEAIKGAIWTDQGLIYVAQMNKKGEFELL